MYIWTSSFFKLQTGKAFFVISRVQFVCCVLMESPATGPTRFIVITLQAEEWTDGQANRPTEYTEKVARFLQSTRHVQLCETPSPKKLKGNYEF